MMELLIVLLMLLAVPGLIVIWVLLAMLNHDSAYEQMKKRIEEDDES